MRVRRRRCLGQADHRRPRREIFNFRHICARIRCRHIWRSSMSNDEEVEALLRWVAECVPVNTACSLEELADGVAFGAILESHSLDTKGVLSSHNFHYISDSERRVQVATILKEWPEAPQVGKGDASVGGRDVVVRLLEGILVASLRGPSKRDAVASIMRLPKRAQDVLANRMQSLLQDSKSESMQRPRPSRRGSGAMSTSTEQLRSSETKRRMSKLDNGVMSTPSDQRYSSEIRRRTSRIGGSVVSIPRTSMFVNDGLPTPMDQWQSSVSRTRISLEVLGGCDSGSSEDEYERTEVFFLKNEAEEFRAKYSKARSAYESEEMELEKVEMFLYQEVDEANQADTMMSENRSEMRRYSSTLETLRDEIWQAERTDCDHRNLELVQARLADLARACKIRELRRGDLAMDLHRHRTRDSHDWKKLAMKSKLSRLQVTHEEEVDELIKAGDILGEEEQYVKALRPEVAQVRKINMEHDQEGLAFRTSLGTMEAGLAETTVEIETYYNRYLEMKTKGVSHLRGEINEIRQEMSDFEELVGSSSSKTLDLLHEESVLEEVAERRRAEMQEFRDAELIVELQIQSDCQDGARLTHEFTEGTSHLQSVKSKIVTCRVESANVASITAKEQCSYREEEEELLRTQASAESDLSSDLEAIHLLDYEAVEEMAQETEVQREIVDAKDELEANLETYAAQEAIADAQERFVEGIEVEGDSLLFEAEENMEVQAHKLASVSACAFEQAQVFAREEATAVHGFKLLVEEAESAHVALKSKIVTALTAEATARKNAIVHWRHHAEAEAVINTAVRLENEASERLRSAPRDSIEGVATVNILAEEDLQAVVAHRRRGLVNAERFAIESQSASTEADREALAATRAIKDEEAEAVAYARAKSQMRRGECVQRQATFRATRENLAREESRARAEAWIEVMCAHKEDAKKIERGGESCLTSSPDNGVGIVCGEGEVNLETISDYENDKVKGEEDWGDDWEWEEEHVDESVEKAEEATGADTLVVAQSDAIRDSDEAGAMTNCEHQNPVEESSLSVHRTMQTQEKADHVVEEAEKAIIADAGSATPECATVDAKAAGAVARATALDEAGEHTFEGVQLQRTMQTKEKADQVVEEAERAVIADIEAATPQCATVDAKVSDAGARDRTLDGAGTCSEAEEHIFEEEQLQRTMQTKEKAERRKRIRWLRKQKNPS
eukprot:TRINITY_DN3374_c0_g1_i4.p1 TRINITY_DN3374_c0_g1~~TRINITY_DN3374_c0_g1_i4.p1  ORF type:complete len:1192 (-),score=246.04 TRINITY_DN3374_c0_g1_i4:668-4243(-)